MCAVMAQKKLVWQIGEDEGDGPTDPSFAPCSSSVSPPPTPDQGRGCGNALFRRMRLNRSIQERSRSLHRGFRYEVLPSYRQSIT